jgi:hypothetical protein
MSITNNEYHYRLDYRIQQYPEPFQYDPLDTIGFSKKADALERIKELKKDPFVYDIKLFKCILIQT